MARLMVKFEDDPKPETMHASSFEYEYEHECLWMVGDEAIDINAETSLQVIS